MACISARPCCAFAISGADRAFVLAVQEMQRLQPHGRQGPNPLVLSLTLQKCDGQATAATEMTLWVPQKTTADAGPGPTAKCWRAAPCQRNRNVVSMGLSVAPNKKEHPMLFFVGCSNASWGRHRGHTLGPLSTQQESRFCGVTGSLRWRQGPLVNAGLFWRHVNRTVGV